MVWRHVERISTVDSLRRIANTKGVDPENARTASLRIRQAVELRRLSTEASAVTRPLLFYYSVLNLVRGVMLTYLGDIGGRSHGLKYESGAGLLSCNASMTRAGTYRRFVESLGISVAALEGTRFQLADLFALMPELVNDFSLLQHGSSAVAMVRVQAIIQGETHLRFHLQDVAADDFKAKWATMFPWFADLCELGSEEFSLRIKVRPQNEEEIAEFCRKYLIHDLRHREDAIWYDDRADVGTPKLPRLAAYLAALFILSNVCRYEPELLDSATRDPSDLSYVIDEFLGHADRFFPQLILELLYGHPAFFE